jgi:outer membrane lipoprotein-sorting protein
MEMKQNMGPQSFDVTVESVELDAGISDDQFAVE